MKRGRPNARSSTMNQILEVLASSRVPVGTAAICKIIEKNTSKQLSWNTVQKYIDELVTIGKIEPIELPHSKDDTKRGMTVYAIKNSQSV